MSTEIVTGSSSGEKDRVVDETVIAESPLEIRLRYWKLGVEQNTQVSVTMRTPGDDEELALGFLFNEQIIAAASDVAEVSPCNGQAGTALRVTLRRDVTPGDALNDRQFYATSSCGVCGKGNEAQIWRSLPEPFEHRHPASRLARETLTSLPERVRARQPLFAETGANHATALFDIQGTMMSLYEDVGRHNATDKLVGAHLLGRFSLPSPGVLFLSGRVSFELMQKAAMLGITYVVAVGAPTSLAVEIARRYDMTLIGFLRGERFNVYSAPERLGPPRR